MVYIHNVVYEHPIKLKVWFYRVGVMYYSLILFKSNRVKNGHFMKKVPSHKRKWYIGTKVQNDLIIYIISMGLLSQLVAISHVYSINIFANESHVLYLRFFVNAIFVGYLIYGLLLTNRIAGPILRLKKHMDEVANGKVDATINFRDKDYSLELAESFNAVVRERINK